MALLEGLELPDLPADEPAGPNLEFDADFGALERAAQGKPEVQFGDTIEPATPPDWKEVEALALSLLARTRDLRVMAHLAIARLNLSGLPGYAGVLTGIRTLLETQWDQVHPQLDPEDDLDPLGRANALAVLADPGRVLRTLRDMPLAGSPRTGGTVSWRDIAILNGAAEAEPGRAKLTEAFVRGTFANTDAARRQAMLAAAALAIEEAARIPAAFNARRASGDPFDLKQLPKLLQEIQRDLLRFEPSEEAGAEDAGADAGAAPGGEVRPDALVPVQRGGISVLAITAVHKREEALHLLELASAYYREHEPSSPLPLLIDRARRLASLGFLEILRDMAPDGLTQAQVVTGPQAGGAEGDPASTGARW